MSENEKPSQNASFPQMEAETLKFWQDNKIFQKSVDKEAPRGDYVFYDGPPFATGTPHYGHIVGQIMKDSVPRYWTMNGYRVERKWGWDCHGLPIENIVEKELGMKSKKDIEELGIVKFNDLCRSKVLEYAEEWYRVAKKLGRWADMEHPYKTMDLDFMESIWWGFKQLWDNNLIYKDYRSMHICPRCETTLSQSEVSDNYKDVKDLSCIAKFELAEEPGTFVLAWTTTPWTLVGNVALAVGAIIEYVKIKVTDESGVETRYILSKERLPEIFKDKKFEILDEFSGSSLTGKAYRPLFDYYVNDEKIANRENGWKIYEAAFVTTTDGTGIVHIAPAFGEDDMALGRENNLPFVQHVELNGNFKPEVKDFPGLNVKPREDHTLTDIEIIKYLAHHGLLFAKEKYEHSYPHCWRCDTPLINYATSSWFVGVTKIKPALLEYAKDINWSPDYIKEGRFGNWLEGARDWSISRQRFWASAIPIWECACGERHVVGSVKELEELTGQKITDIHKDKVDPLTFPCPKCGGTMTRIPDVLDCWFESGSMPYAQLHYPFENREKFEANFPAQFIAEGADQTRCWFYYMHVISGGIKQTHAFNNVIVNGIVLAEDGKKMAKRLKNYPDPELVIDKYGADALRAYLLSSPVMQAENLNFSEKGVAEALRKNIMILWNVYKFYELYATPVAGQEFKLNASNVLDQWILSKVEDLNREVQKSMEAYNLPKAMRPITDFIDELSTWYLRRSRDRFKSENENDKQEVLNTLGHTLFSLSKIMAPFLPFVAESLYQKVSGYNFANPDKSVHLEQWSKVSDSKSAEQEVIQEKMAAVRRIVELGLAQRDEAGIKIRQMLGSLKAKVPSESPAKDLGIEYLELIKDELNVKDVVLENVTDKDLSVSLDIVITPELKIEGLKRELIRFINLMRKENNLSLQDRAEVYYQTVSEDIKEAVRLGIEEIKRETLSLDIIDGDNADGWKKEVKVDDQVLTLVLLKK